MTFWDIFLIGIGLAVDASCVCTSNGLTYKPSIRDTIKYALVFAVFQGIMPLLGYLLIGLFSVKIFEYNQLIALILLAAVGLKMIYESFGENQETGVGIIGKKLTASILFIQGVTTSIDALSVGITFNNYSMHFVLYAVTLIAIITFVMCVAAVRIGIKIGTRLNNKAEMVGGLVLVLLGIKIFVVG
ncbi:MAG: manganese efflux pump [Lachnospiraceae bacterium]